ncbi:MAG: hypothetical protein U9N11_06985 [Campylobacterota bacterium]|nr:hypothetical protein [Campylobacterota bacterium]
MNKSTYAIREILESIYSIKEKKIKKRLIYQNAIFGGINNIWIKLSFFALPFLMYAAVFNPISFKELGIAQAIVFYIILLVVAMQIVVAISFFNNKKVLNLASKEWKKYFPDVELKIIITSGATPYKDFKYHYEKSLEDNVEDEVLTNRLNNAFKTMESENSVMYQAMKKDKEKRDKNA